MKQQYLRFGVKHKESEKEGGALKTRVRFVLAIRYRR